MTVDMILSREVLHSAPDGNSVKRTEQIRVQTSIENLEVLANRSESYLQFGDWKVVGFIKEVPHV